MIELEHPRLVWLALAPLGLWLLATLARAPQAPSGTVELWRELDRAAPRSRRRAWTDWRLWCASLALVAGALALAAPIRRGERPQTLWHVLVDGSPSMHLAWSGAEAADSDGRSRLARALELAQPWLAARRAAGDELVWVRWRAGAFEERRADACPSEWLRPTEVALAPPPFERCDAPGWVWITDVAREPRAAGLFASGGPAVPGVVAESARELFEWRGEGLVARPRPPARVALAADVPMVLGELVAAWAGARGLTVGQEPAALAVVTVAGGEDRRAVGGRGGWRLQGNAAALELEPDERAWLLAQDGSGVLVATRPGRVRVAWRSLNEPEGDLALCAVDWSELLDSVRLSAPEVVALDERRAAGESLVREPDDAPGAVAPIERRYSAELALAAALFALLLFL